MGQSYLGQAYLGQAYLGQAYPQYSPCLCEGVASRRATLSHKHGLCPPFDFQQAFMWNIAGRRPTMFLFLGSLHMFFLVGSLHMSFLVGSLRVFFLVVSGWVPCVLFLWVPKFFLFLWVPVLFSVGPCVFFCGSLCFFLWVPVLFFRGVIGFGQFRLRPISTSAKFNFGQFLDSEFWDDKVWTQKSGGGPKGGGPKPRKSGAPKGGAPKGGAQNFALFFPSSATMFFLLSLSWGPCVEFWWCLKRRGPEMCTFGVLGLSCASPDSPRTPNVHISGFLAFKYTNRIPRKDPKREREQ